jgi:hypothetical protein
MVEPAVLVKLIFLLCAHVPPHLDAFDLELGGVDTVPLNFMSNSVVSISHPLL